MEPAERTQSIEIVEREARWEVYHPYVCQIAARNGLRLLPIVDGPA
jgi:hypothetical protein